MKLNHSFIAITIAITVFIPIVLGDTIEQALGLETYTKSKYVWELQDDTFLSEINSHLILVMFYTQSGNPFGIIHKDLYFLAKASSVLKSVYANAAKQNRATHPNVKVNFHSFNRLIFSLLSLMWKVNQR
jgi:hypothetical protein